MSKETNGIAVKKDCNDLYGSEVFSIQSIILDNTYTGYCPTYQEIISTNKFNINGTYQTNQLVKYNDIIKINPLEAYNLEILINDGGNKYVGACSVDYLDKNGEPQSTILDITNGEYTYNIVAYLNREIVYSSLSTFCNIVYNGVEMDNEFEIYVNDSLFDVINTSYGEGISLDENYFPIGIDYNYIKIIISPISVVPTEYGTLYVKAPYKSNMNGAPSHISINGEYVNNIGGSDVWTITSDNSLESSVRTTTTIWTQILSGSSPVVGASGFSETANISLRDARILMNGGTITVSIK